MTVFLILSCCLCADTDSLSQMSSTGSSGEEEKPETLLGQHFDTMANNLASDGMDDIVLLSLYLFGPLIPFPWRLYFFTSSFFTAHIC